MDAVVVNQLSHVYPARRPAKIARQALKGVSFAIQKGEIFGLLGPNGGGKSTTFHILSTYFKPTGGTASMMGHDVVSEAEAVRHLLGVVFQSPGLDKKLTVLENLMHQGHLYGLSGKPLQDRIAFVLDRVKLTDRRDEVVESLSGGMKRRVEVAKGLLHKPQVLLLDEPSTGLDPGARRDLWTYLRELKSEENITIVVTTHLMEEAETCDRVAILHEGELVALGSPAELKRQIGGDVISIEADNPIALAKDIEDKFHTPARLVDGLMRIERNNGHEFIPLLVSAFPGRISSVTLGKPTLEDVFIQRTGRRFERSENAS